MNIRLKESEVTQACPNVCGPMDCRPPGSSVHGIFQARILEWVAISSSRGSSQTRDWTLGSSIAGRRFTIWATRELLGCNSRWRDSCDLRESCQTELKTGCSQREMSLGSQELTHNSCSWNQGWFWRTWREVPKASSKDTCRFSSWDILFILFPSQQVSNQSRSFERNHLWPCINSPVFSKVDMKIKRRELLLKHISRSMYNSISQHFYPLSFS